MKHNWREAFGTDTEGCAKELVLNPVRQWSTGDTLSARTEAAAIGAEKIDRFEGGLRSFAPRIWWLILDGEEERILTDLEKSTWGR